MGSSTRTTLPSCPWSTDAENLQLSGQDAPKQLHRSRWCSTTVALEIPPQQTSGWWAAGVLPAGILEENQYLHSFLLNTNISLFEVVKCCGFFCWFAFQVVLCISHWKKYLLKLYLCNSKITLIFGEEWGKAFIFLSSEEPPSFNMCSSLVTSFG